MSLSTRRFPTPRLAAVLALLLAAPGFSLSSVPARAAPADERVALAGFAIDRTEVTIGRFRAFVAATGLVTQAERSGMASNMAPAGSVARAGTGSAPSAATPRPRRRQTHPPSI